MITRAITFALPIDSLDRMSVDDADHYIKRKALNIFFDELVKHIEPESIDDNKHNYYLDNMVTFKFLLIGGSLPDHESDT